MPVKSGSAQSAAARRAVSPSAYVDPRRGSVVMLIGLAAVLLLIIIIRVRLLDMPLERDEGEYAYSGQLLLQGVPPYQDLYSMKWPGTFIAYALMMALFGQTIAGIHIGLILVNLVSALLVLLIAKRVCGTMASCVAAAVFALLAASPPGLGLAGHATHFVLLPALGGVWLLQVEPERSTFRRLSAAGFFFGVAALMKQSGAAFGLFAFMWLIWRQIKGADSKPEARARSTAPAPVKSEPLYLELIKRLSVFTASMLTPLVFTAAWLAMCGVFGRFWLWTIQYSREYLAIHSLPEGWALFSQACRKLFIAAPELWSLAAVGIPILFLSGGLRKWRLFLIGFSTCSFLAVCPGWHFRAHYFLLLLPAVGLWAAVMAAGVAEIVRSKGLPGWCGLAPIILLSLAGARFVAGSREIFFSLPPEAACRAIYGGNPFPEAVAVGKYLADHCPPGQKVAVIGSEPEIYFYSGRKSATGFVYTYPLLEPQPYARQMRDEMIAELSRSDADYFVFVSVPVSWLPRPDSDLSIVEWFLRYRQEQLDLIGTVEVRADAPPVSHWTAPFTPGSENFLQVYRRKGLACLPSHSS